MLFENWRKKRKARKEAVAVPIEDVALTIIRKLDEMFLRVKRIKVDIEFAGVRNFKTPGGNRYSQILLKFQNHSDVPLVCLRDQVVERLNSMALPMSVMVDLTFTNKESKWNSPDLPKLSSSPTLVLPKSRRHG